MNKKSKISKKKEFIAKDAHLVSVKYKVSAKPALCNYSYEELEKLQYLINVEKEYRDAVRNKTLIDITNFKRKYEKEF